LTLAYCIGSDFQNDSAKVLLKARYFIYIMMKYLAFATKKMLGLIVPIRSQSQSLRHRLKCCELPNILCILFEFRPGQHQEIRWILMDHAMLRRQATEASSGRSLRRTFM